MTSLTRTDTARRPGGMTGGSPAPASFDASFIGRIGSYWTTAITSPRPTASFGSLMASAGTELAGHSMTFTSSAVSSEPSGRSDAATTTGLLGMAAPVDGVDEFETYLYVPMASAPPAVSASRSTRNTRMRAIWFLFFGE